MSIFLYFPNLSVVTPVLPYGNLCPFILSNTFRFTSLMFFLHLPIHYLLLFRFAWVYIGGSVHFLLSTVAILWENNSAQIASILVWFNYHSNMTWVRRVALYLQYGVLCGAKLHNRYILVSYFYYYYFLLTDVIKQFYCYCTI